MSPIKIWGPATWTFFHTLIDKIRDESFLKIYREVFIMIRIICMNLPCPDCAAHAKKFLASVPLYKISTKLDFKQMMCVFHNSVNIRTKSAVFSLDDLDDRYRNIPLNASFRRFLTTYNTRGTMKYFAEEYQRGQTIKRLNLFLRKNSEHFIHI